MHCSSIQVPSPVLLGSIREWKVHKGNQKLEEVKHYGYTIDFLSSIRVYKIHTCHKTHKRNGIIFQALLSNPAARDEIECSHQSRDGVLRDYCDGNYFKTHPVFKKHPSALHVILYYDDIEIANALGSKAGFHKLGMSVHTNIRNLV